MKHIIKVESFDNLSSVRPLIAMMRGQSDKPKFSIKEPRIIITGTWDISKTDNTKEVLIRGDVTLNGKTDCYSLLFEDENSHLIINAGARLRVWEGGIVNDNCTTVNYLTIIEDSVNESYGEFLLHPNVLVNNHPLASVQLVSKSFYENNNNYQWERFSIPTRTTLKSIESNLSGLYTGIQIFENEHWVDLGYLQTGVNFANIARLNKPFNVCNLLAYRNQSTPNAVYTFKGELVGNLDAELDDRLEWNANTNGYTGKIKTRVLLNCLNEGMILYDRINNIQITEDNVSQYPYIYPITGEIYLRNSTLKWTIQILSYKDLVWDPSFEEEVIQTSSLMKGSLTSPKPT